MILQEEAIVNREVYGNLQGYDFAISDDPQELSFLLKTMSKLYSNPYAFVVEWIQNAVDTTKAAGSQKPVIVTVDNDEQGWYFSVQDFGEGMDEERVKTFTTFGKSTKRSTTTQAGRFG